MRKGHSQPGFSWTIALITSGVCYLGLSGFMELLNNNFPSIFMWAGMISMSLGCLLAIGSLFFEEIPENNDRFFVAE